MDNTIAQERSKFALDEIGVLKVGKEDPFSKLVSGLPVMILQNGFGQALAFLLAKGTDKHLQAFDIVVKWLRNREILLNGSRGQAVLALSELPQDKYLYAQEEAIKVLEWVKRYASAGLFSE